jgi:energy-converting hydrogenase Eha subunit E
LLSTALVVSINTIAGGHSSDAVGDILSINSEICKLIFELIFSVFNKLLRSCVSELSFVALLLLRID